MRVGGVMSGRVGCACNTRQVFIGRFMQTTALLAQCRQDSIDKGVGLLSYSFSTVMPTSDSYSICWMNNVSEAAAVWRNSLKSLLGASGKQIWPFSYSSKFTSDLVLCEYSKFRIESNSYFTIRFDSKPTQLFEIFKYLSLVYTGDLNAVFDDYNGDYSRRKGDKLSPFRANTVAVSATIVAVPDDYSQSPFRATKSDKLSPFRATTVAVFGNYYRQKLFDLIRNFK